MSRTRQRLSSLLNTASGVKSVGMKFARLLPLLALGFLGQTQQISLQPCTPNKVAGLCGTYSVAENRGRPGGRQIALRVFVAPSPAAKKASDPIFLIEGGPGQSTVEHLESSDLLPVYRTIARDRDIIAVEERGVGGPDALICPGNSSPRTLQDDLLDLADVARACLPWAKSRASLDRYNSLDAIADLDEVRAAMGVDKINLWALSHGSREALLYAEHYPKHTRAVVLEAPLGTNQHMPAGLAVREDEVLKAVFADCTADKECAAKYPQLRQDYAAVLAAFAHGPIQVRLADPHTKQETTIAFSKGRFAETVRNLLYTVPDANRIPAILHAAAAGDWKPLVLFSAQSRIDSERFPFAMWMSYVCAEDIPYIDERSERKLSERTLLGDYRVAQQKAACALWPTAHLPDGWDKPQHSDVPVLFVVGAQDIITSPARAREIAAPFPKSRVVEVAHGSHLLVGQSGEDECLLRIEGDVLQKGSTEGIDTACAAALPRGPWK